MVSPQQVDFYDYKLQTYLICSCKHCKVVWPKTKSKVTTVFQEIHHAHDSFSPYFVRWPDPK